jgi:hypothetical protein
MGDIIDYDDNGNPIYGEASKKDTGKSFDDAIKDLYWDVLGREPDAAGIEYYKKQFGEQISPKEEQRFYQTAQEELRGRGKGAGDPLYNLYAKNLGRAPTLEEYRKSRQQFGGDVSGEEEQKFFEQKVVPGLRQSQDPIYQLYQQELGRNPDIGGYRYYREKFGSPINITESMRQQFRAVGGEEVTSRIPDAFRTLMGRDPTQQEIQELSRNVGTLNPNQMGEYLATKNRAFTSRYTQSPTAAYVAQNIPSNLTPFTRTQDYVPLSRPNVSASMNLAGQQYYQTPTSSGVNYIGAPTTIAPITQGFQPVGMPSSFGGKGGFQFQPQARSQQMPTQEFQPMGGKGAPKAITGKGG